MKGFKSRTYRLTSTELKVAGLVLEKLTLNIGREKAVTNNKMRTILKEKYGVNVPAPRLRKILHILRVTGDIKRLVATERGYYRTNSVPELREYIDSLGERIARTKELHDAMVEQLKEYETNMQGTLL